MAAGFLAVRMSRLGDRICQGFELIRRHDPLSFLILRCRHFLEPVPIQVFIIHGTVQQGAQDRTFPFDGSFCSSFLPAVLDIADPVLQSD
ncbi:MAG: hypothetical protein A3H49_10090 [Nitrospirae bacterium RIFCSPLOWO2_02_FULL_62_14]|nr:MAG: hypothetical protein A3H49_10090 [Nitrospirae bacterium RIFCSPLOWO2_02_FULL_62_14]OGW68134.1 MAG: hypothetical protein A3A88_00725 [Nitrospirae bacterium RIFCSPLOWO2_01_FULL_62_17]